MLFLQCIFISYLQVAKWANTQWKYTEYIDVDQMRAYWDKENYINILNTKWVKILIYMHVYHQSQILQFTTEAV